MKTVRLSLVARKRRVPPVDGSSDADSFNRVMTEGIGEQWRNRVGRMYGCYKDGQVYLNPDLVDINTPIHEIAGHAGIKATKEVNRPLYDKGMKDIQQTDYFKDVSKDPYYSKKSLIERCEEALARLIADRGERLVKGTGVGARLTQWIKDFWKGFKNVLGIRDITPEQVEKMTVEDVADAILAETNSGHVFGEGERAANERAADLEMLKEINKEPVSSNWQPGAREGSPHIGGNGKKVTLDYQTRPAVASALSTLRETAAKGMPPAELLGRIKAAFGLSAENESGYVIQKAESGLLSLRISGHYANGANVRKNETMTGSYVVLTEMKEAGRNVVVAVAMEKQGYGGTLIHDIRSLYGKEGGFAIQQWVDDGMLLYANKQKIRSSPKSLGLQLPVVKGKNGNPYLTEEDLPKDGDIVANSAEGVKALPGLRKELTPVFGDQTFFAGMEDQAHVQQQELFRPDDIPDPKAVKMPGINPRDVLPPDLKQTEMLLKENLWASILAKCAEQGDAYDWTKDLNEACRKYGLGEQEFATIDKPIVEGWRTYRKTRDLGPNDVGKAVMKMQGPKARALAEKCYTEGENEP